MKLIADLHTHTISSGHAYSTVKEILEEAHAKKLSIVAITDHGPAMPGGPHLYHFGNIGAIPIKWKDVEVLRGVEANIIDYEGNIDIPRDYLKYLDIILAGFHVLCYPGGTVEENTQALINSMKNNMVDIIVHPGNPEYQIDPERLVRASKEYGVALEINNSSLTTARKGSYEHCEYIAKLVAKHGTLISIGSDSHWAETVGYFPKALEMISRAGIREEQILNTSVARIKDYLKLRKQNRRQITGGMI